MSRQTALGGACRRSGDSRKPTAILASAKGKAATLLNIRLSKDLCAGIVFLLVGLAAIWWGRDLRFGTAANMGPGFMPVVLGWMLTGMGAMTIARSFWLQSDAFGSLRLRPILLILASVIGFALLVERVGFVPAMVVSVFLSTLAAEKPTLPYVLSMCIALPLAAVVVFIWGLGLPFDLWWF